MDSRSVARSVVKPVIGPDRWEYLHDLKVAVRKTNREHARRAEAAKSRASDLQRVASLSDDAIVARARAIEDERKKAELRALSPDLTALAKTFKTDKWGNHFYTPHYQAHLQHLRARPVKVLEIGIGGYARAGDGGASLRMWKHFFPQGQITGLDIQDKSFVVEDRIRAYQGDQTDPELLARINAEAGPFDVIIDDGSHRPAHIIASFDVLFPLLADDGIYVVEDIQTSYWPEHGGAEDPEDSGTSMAMLKRLCDGLNYMEYVDESYEPTYTDLHVISTHFYHNLVFIQKGTNTEGTRRRQILRKRYAAAAEQAAAPTS